MGSATGELLDVALAVPPTLLPSGLMEQFDQSDDLAVIVDQLNLKFSMILLLSKRSPLIDYANR